MARLAAVTLAGLLILACQAMAHAQEKPEKERAWERVIKKFEATDAETPPPDAPMLFTGSSSIVLWKVNEAFPEWPVLNRGFGGSNFGDLNHFFERVVLRYRPRVLVIYSGDNDIASGQPADEVFAEFKRFADRVRDELPETRLAVISVKPSKARWHLWPESQQVNEKISAYAVEHAQVTYVDLATPLLDEQGEPNLAYFVGDRLHLNAKGYEQWNAVIQPVLEELWSASAPEKAP